MERNSHRFRERKKRVVPKSRNKENGRKTRKKELTVMRAEVERFKRKEKNVQKKDGSSVSGNRLTMQQGIYAHGCSSGSVRREPGLSKEAKARAEANLTRILELANNAPASSQSSKAVLRTATPHHSFALPKEGSQDVDNLSPVSEEMAKKAIPTSSEPNKSRHKSKRDECNEVVHPVIESSEKDVVKKRKAPMTSDKENYKRKNIKKTDSPINKDTENVEASQAEISIEDQRTAYEKVMKRVQEKYKEKTYIKGRLKKLLGDASKKVHKLFLKRCEERQPQDSVVDWGVTQALRQLQRNANAFSQTSPVDHSKTSENVEGPDVLKTPSSVEYLKLSSDLENTKQEETIAVHPVCPGTTVVNPRSLLRRYEQKQSENAQSEVKPRKSLRKGIKKSSFAPDDSKQSVCLKGSQRTNKDSCGKQKCTSDGAEQLKEQYVLDGGSVTAKHNKSKTRTPLMDICLPSQPNCPKSVLVNPKDYLQKYEEQAKGKHEVIVVQSKESQEEIVCLEVENVLKSKTDSALLSHVPSESVHYREGKRAFDSITNFQDSKFTTPTKVMKLDEEQLKAPQINKRPFDDGPAGADRDSLNLGAVGSRSSPHQIFDPFRKTSSYSSTQSFPVSEEHYNVLSAHSSTSPFHPRISLAEPSCQTLHSVNPRGCSTIPVIQSPKHAFPLSNPVGEESNSVLMPVNKTEHHPNLVHPLYHSVCNVPPVTSYVVEESHHPRTTLNISPVYKTSPVFSTDPSLLPHVKYGDVPHSKRQLLASNSETLSSVQSLRQPSIPSTSRKFNHSHQHSCELTYINPQPSSSLCSVPHNSQTSQQLSANFSRGLHDVGCSGSQQLPPVVEGPRPLKLRYASEDSPGFYLVTDSPDISNVAHHCCMQQNQPSAYQPSMRISHNLRYSYGADSSSHSSSQNTTSQPSSEDILRNQTHYLPPRPPGVSCKDGTCEWMDSRNAGTIPVPHEHPQARQTSQVDDVIRNSAIYGDGTSLDKHRFYRRKLY